MEEVRVQKEYEAFVSIPLAKRAGQVKEMEELQNSRRPSLQVCLNQTVGCNRGEQREFKRPTRRSCSISPSQVEPSISTGLRPDLCGEGAFQSCGMDASPV